MSVSFHNADVKFTLPNKTALKKFIAKRINYESGKKARFTYVFCSDTYLLNINKQFLNHDYFIDIITFPLNETSVEIEAEIYISIERVKENAIKFATNKQKVHLKKDSFLFELHRVIFHGALHLIGYQDKNSKKRAEMKKMEDEWLSEFNNTRNH